MCRPDFMMLICWQAHLHVWKLVGVVVAQEFCGCMNCFLNQCFLLILSAVMENWQCPRCLRNVAAETNVRLYWNISRHIQEHEDRAATQAVDRARMGCMTPDCSLGRTFTPYGTRISGLTDFDQKLLKGLLIKWDDTQTPS